MREQYNPFIGHTSLKNLDYRLPKNVKPTHYDITLEPNLENGSFKGSVTIYLDVLQKSSFIILNTNELDILSTNVTDATGKVIKIPKVHHESEQTMTVPLQKPLPADSKIWLEHTFNGRLNDAKEMSGFNRSRYTGYDGTSKWIGSTQGQPTGARQIFPCADEPGLKATFSATLIVEQGLTTLSNMDIASEKERSDGKKIVVFNKTPPMSTYLVAFVVGELNYIESNAFRIPVRVYATPEQDLQQGAFSLNVGARSMITHEKTFGSPYPLPKIDMVAVPGHSGGMENWGCVIYAEKYLISDESDASAINNTERAYVIIHELAHQWFGNIVTAEWWDSIWLNESFADWASYHAVTTMYPEWEAWSEFVAGPSNGGLQAYQAALELDSNRRSHPIEVPVNTPTQIATIFDSITYAKGCTVLRMISELLGVEVFIKGVRLYLKRHAFGNATTSDLWDSLGNFGGPDVKKIMSTWTQKVGYPILHITENAYENTISISQHRFIQSGKVPPKDDQVLYPIFLKIRDRQGEGSGATLFSREDTFPADLSFYKLNSSQTGLYRVAYPLSRWMTLAKQLYTPGLLTPSDRVGLISDFRAIVTAGQTPTRTSNLLIFLSKFRNERNFFVWRHLLECLQDIRKAWLFEDASSLAALFRFQSQLLKPTLSQYGEDLWNFAPSDTYLEQSFKAVLFNSAENDKVKYIAAWYFDRFMDGQPETLNPNIRAAVFRIVMVDFPDSVEHNYDRLLRTFRTTKSLGTRGDALSALGHASLPSLIQRSITLATSPELQSSNERNAVFSSLATHRNGIAALWAYLQKEWDKIVGERGGIMNGTFVGSCIKGFSTREQLEVVETFLREKRKDAKGFERVERFVEQSLDVVKAKANWVERDRENVKEWLEHNGYF